MATLFGSDESPTPEPLAGYARVAVERAVDLDQQGLTYAVPASLADLAVGERVLVPLGRGNQTAAGYVVARLDETPLDPRKIKPIAARDAGALSLTPRLIELAQWMAGYYVAPLGMTLASMLPAAVKHGTGAKTRTFIQLPPPEAPPPPEVEASKQKLSAVQQQILDTAHRLVAEGREAVELRELADLAGVKTTGPVKRLLERGLLRQRQQNVVESDLDLRAAQAVEPLKSVTLGAAQQRALDHLAKHLHAGFSAHLLHGVTGSGKTEVYLRLIEQLRPPEVSDEKLPGAGELPGVLILVPEIALTPQTVARFLARFDDVAVLHSGLTASQRHAQWRRVRRGEARLVIGARSAVFAPVQDLGLIIVDEEHESSYKQDQSPRYHGRDVAIKLAQLAQVPVVLGSATPSLESWRNATDPDAGHFHYVSLPDRVPGMKLPEVRLVDLSQERRKRYEMTGSRGVHLLSLSMEQALRLTLKAGRQAMLLLNRRGYANYIACPDHHCGWMMTCEHCDAAMVFHKLPPGSFAPGSSGANTSGGGVVRCHHCGFEQRLPATCPNPGCGNKVTLFGIGTQRVEEELASKFPGARYVRMDSDTMRSAKDYQQTLDRFRLGEIDILLGTQMIAKGLDFPGVSLVGVISADTALNLPDFRAGERTFQLVSQVSGRAGRSEHPGLSVVQSFNIEDPVIQLAAAHDYAAFAQRELELRRDARLPPVARMARIVVRHRDPEKVKAIAHELAGMLHQANDAAQLDVRLVGPLACSIARIADHHRMELTLTADPPHAAGKLQQLMATLRQAGRLVSDATTAVDVDPVSLL